MLWFTLALVGLAFCWGVLIGAWLGVHIGEDNEARRCERWHAGRERLRLEDDVKFRGRW